MPKEIISERTKDRVSTEVQGDLVGLNASEWMPVFEAFTDGIFIRLSPAEARQLAADLIAAAEQAATPAPELD